jgi:glycosyltransferase involved in cell wall biosynthesis
MVTMSKSKDDYAEAVSKSGLFDESWYIEQYPDVKALGMDALEHYLWLGARLGRNPSKQFCAASYLDANPDVARAKLDPLSHYLLSGKLENRPIYPVLSVYERTARAKCKRLIDRRIRKWNINRESDFLEALNQLDIDANDLFVSIIMPTKDRANSIGKAIDSALAQTHTNFELVIIDDGSKDHTKDVIEKYTDERIHYIQYEENSGVSVARNRGLDRARGEWIFFLDSDNTWRPSMLDAMLRFVSHQQVSAAYCAANLIDDEGTVKSVLYADFDYESCLQENFIDLNAFCVKRPIAEIGFDTRLRRLVDWDFILRVGAHTRVLGAPFVGVDYYDGASKNRITNCEYKENTQIDELLTQIRNKAKQYLQEARTHHDESRYKIAAVLHVYHKELVQECLSHLSLIDFRFDLFVTTSLDTDDDVFELIRARYPDVKVIQYPNIGSDLAPFLELSATLKNYFLVCKLHTKRDVGKWGAHWRTNLLRSILNSTADVNKIVERFVNNDDLVMAGSKEFYKLGEKNSIAETLAQVNRIASDIGLSSYLEKQWSFFAGTMFWARPALFLKLARYMSDSPGYSVTFRQDGGLEHGLERLLGIAPWSRSGAMVALVEPLTDGTVGLEECGIDEGFSIEGVSASLNKLVASKPLE